MDVLLQKHGARHIYTVPEGLRELCTDISREVLRSQPTNIYEFIADYVDALLITRENTKAAIKIVNNILRGSEAILSVLYRSGLSLEQIAISAPRVQEAFRAYLDELDVQAIQPCEDATCDERSRVSLRSILEATGVPFEHADHAATIIQAAFRGHYERMLLNEAQGKIQWQRAVANTISILKKAGVPQIEITKAAPLIQYAYRGYYARRNMKMFGPDEKEKQRKVTDVTEPRETIQAVAWMDTMFHDSDLTIEQANDAAHVIQKAYREYRVRRGCYDVQRLESTKSMVVEAVIESVRQKVFERVTCRDEIPTEYGSREDMTETSVKLQMVYKEHLRQHRLSEEGHLSPNGIETDEPISFDVSSADDGEQPDERSVGKENTNKEFETEGAHDHER